MAEAVMKLRFWLLTFRPPSSDSRPPVALSALRLRPGRLPLRALMLTVVALRALPLKKVVNLVVLKGAAKTLVPPVCRQKEQCEKPASAPDDSNGAASSQGVEKMLAADGRSLSAWIGCHALA